MDAASSPRRPGHGSNRAVFVFVFGQGRIDFAELWRMSSLTDLGCDAPCGRVAGPTTADR